MPEISQEMLVKQLRVLNTQKQNHMSDLSAVNGAIQLAEWLLQQLNEDPENELTPDGAELNGDDNESIKGSSENA